MKELRIPESSFVLSCPHIGLAPKLRLWEIAFAGRSNVGKSSLINSLLNRKSLSLTSKTPGKTRLLNYFLIGKNLCYFVDLPGYGYAKVGQAMKEEWGETIEGYLEESQLLALVVLLIDMRHGPTVLDKQMIEGLAILRRPWIAVLTKSDKLGAQEKAKQMKALYGELISSGARGVLPYSSLNNIGRNEVWQEIFKAIEAKK